MSEVDFGELAPVSRRTMVLFFMVDTSGSMAGSKIGQVNIAVREAIPEIVDIAADNIDADIKIAVLTFDSSAQWLYSTPVAASDFQWQDLDSGGLTSFGEACEKLNEKLSRKGNGFMAEVTGSLAPVIILLSDGEPTDNWESSLEKLRKNRWFKSATKIAIAIGKDAVQETNKKVLDEFTGRTESVMLAPDPKALRKLIRVVAVTSSQIGSQSSPLSDNFELNGNNSDEAAYENDGSAVMEQIKKENPDVYTGEMLPVIDINDIDGWED